MGSTCKYIKLEWNHTISHNTCKIGCCCCFLSLSALLLPAGSSKGTGEVVNFHLQETLRAGLVKVLSSKCWIWLELDRPCGPCPQNFPRSNPKSKPGSVFPEINTMIPTCRSSSRRILSSSFRLSSSLFDSSFLRSSLSASSA